MEDVLSKILAVILVVFAALTGRPAAASEPLTVFSAASMKEAIERAAAAFEAEMGVETVVSLAASSVLARQIAAGAPADVFISADREWMDWLAERELLRKETVTTVAANALVIVSSEPADGTADPAALLARGRFAMGDPGHVPAGRYAKAALEALGLWETVKTQAVFAENVRVALELARRGEVAAAIVYASDEEVAEGLVRLYTFPAESHPPILYPAAATKGAAPQAEAFLAFLSGASGRAIFRELGFASPR